MLITQGDSVDFVVYDLPTDTNYYVYFSFYDKNRKILGQELPVETNKNDFVRIQVGTAFTDLLKVDPDEETTEYYYGIKICDPDTGLEETLVIGNKEVGELNVVTVYPKQVEGLQSSLEV